MRSRILIAISSLISLTPTLLFASESEQKFCEDLAARGIAHRAALGERLFYRNETGEPVELARTDKISRDVTVMFYYVHGEDSELGQKSVLNFKFIYKTSKPISRRLEVGLTNNQWPSSRIARIRNDCAGLTIDGYERFHLDNTRSYCLSRHFHQEAPFNTLATVEQRQSFAFQDMLGTQSSGFFDLISNLLISPARAIEPSQLSSTEGTLARSWIWNYEYGTSPTGKCISFKPDFPDSAKSVSIRITNHGVNFFPHARDWSLTFLE